MNCACGKQLKLNAKMCAPCLAQSTSNYSELSFKNRIAVLNKVPIYFDRTFYLFYITFSIISFIIHEWTQAINIILAVFVAFSSVLLHEFAHVFIGNGYNISTKEVRFYMFGALAFLDRMPDDPISQFKIAAAGPTLNLIISCISFGMLLLIDQSWVGIQQMLITITLINIVIGVFNMLPVFPLDGGVMLKSIIWLVLGDQTKATKTAIVIAYIGCFAFIIGGAIIFDIILLLVGILILIANSAQLSSMNLKRVV